MPLLLLLTPALLLVTPAPAQAQTVVLIQESNGFPGGQRTGALARQQIVVNGPLLRVLDVEHMWALFIDLEGETVREAAVDQKQYVERDFDHYKKYANDRAKNLRDQAAEWQRQYERAEGDAKRQRELVADYQRMGGDPKSPGKISARRQHFQQDTKTIELMIDRELKRVTLEHYMIRENQASKPIFDLWTTTDVELSADLMKFYRQLGTFSPEVTAELLKVPGTVIECTALLDTGTLKKRFTSKVVEIRTSERVRGSLTVPAGWKKVKDTDKGPKPPVAQMRLCEVCQAVIPGGKGLKFTIKRRRHWVCSQPHRIVLIKRIAAAEKRKKRRLRSSQKPK